MSVFASISSVLLLLCFISYSYTADDSALRVLDKDAVFEIKAEISEMLNQGRTIDIIRRLEEVNKTYGTLNLDDDLPTLYGFIGVALYNSHKMDEAEAAFIQAVTHKPDEIRSWLNLGEIRVQTFRIKGAIEALQTAFALGDVSSLPRLLRTKGWSADWSQYDAYSSDLEKLISDCRRSLTICRVDSTSAFEYSDVTGEDFKLLTKHNSGTNMAIKSTLSQSMMEKPYKLLSKRSHRLKIGFISSDFGVHPVSSLVRGLLQLIDKENIELYCFSLKSDISWWGHNVSAEVEHFQVLRMMNQREAAELIHSFRIDIMIDLNGLTLHSGLSILSHRPAPIQISYLGLPTTTGADFIDFFLSDYVATPPEHAAHYTEKMLLMPPCNIVNDYAQMQGDIVNITWRNQPSRGLLKFDTNLYPNYLKSDNATDTKEIERMLSINQTQYVLDADLLLATLSNSQKMDPLIFTVWMNILRVFGRSAMTFTDYAASMYYSPELFKMARYYGIEPHRLVLLTQAPWIDHLYLKTPLDLVLDTFVKNGHTSGLDGVWAGVPTITFTFQHTAPARAGQSIAEGMNSKLGLATSFKDYEDIAIGLLRHSRHSYAHNQKQANKSKHSKKYQRNKQNKSNDPSHANSNIKEHHELLLKWRDEISDLRVRSELFDTRLFSKRFTLIMQALYDSYYVNLVRNKGTDKKYHIFASKSRFPIKEEITPVHQQYDQGSVFFPGVTQVKPQTPKDPNLPTVDYSKYHLGCLMDEFKDWPSIPSEVFDGRLVLLNIGGTRPADGWYTVNIRGGGYFHPGTDAEIYRPMGDLFGFPDNSVATIYSSHTLEHNSFGDSQLSDTLREWFRVIRPGGLLLVSVPDLMTLAKLYLRTDVSVEDRVMLMKMIYGAQSDSADFHYVGFDYPLLHGMLEHAGFCNISRVQSFNMRFIDPVTKTGFTDTSDLTFLGHYISLNVVAKVCRNERKPQIIRDTFSIDVTQATPYVDSIVREGS